MAFNGSNYVEQAAGGGFNSIVNGQATHYADQAAAEQAFNAAQGGGTDTSGTGFNYQAASIAAQAANNAAQMAYYNAQLDFQKYQFNNLSAYQKEQIALDRAKQAWTETYQKGLLDLQKQSQQDTTALGMMNVAKDLRGPADYAQYLKTMNSTPQGLRDVFNAAWGRYQMPSSAGGSATEGASLATMANDLTTGAAAKQAEYQAALGTYYGPGVSAPTVAGLAAKPVNATVTTPALQTQAAPAATSTVTTPTATPAADKGTPLTPGQWSAQNIANMNPTQRAMLMSATEDQLNWTQNDINDAYKRSLPKYTGPKYGVMKVA